MVLHRPPALARVIGNWEFHISGKRVYRPLVGGGALPTSRTMAPSELAEDTHHIRSSANSPDCANGAIEWKSRWRLTQHEKSSGLLVLLLLIGFALPAKGQDVTPRFETYVGYDYMRDNATNDITHVRLRNRSMATE